MSTIGAKYLAAVAATLLACAGCVMPDQLSQMQKDLADVRQQLRRVQQDQGEALRKLEAFEAQAAEEEQRVTRADIAEVSVRIDQLASDVAISDERINELGRRVDRLAQQVQQNRDLRDTRRPPPVGGPLPEPTGADAPAQEPGLPPTGGTALPDPESLYNTAYADFSKGNYTLAVSGFEEYAEKFPDSALADNAVYWIGECHFSQGSFPEAIAAFDRLLSSYPTSDKAAAGNLKKGLAYLEQNEVARAIVQLRFVISEFPGSDEAKIARDKLTSLGASF